MPLSCKATSSGGKPSETISSLTVWPQICASAAWLGVGTLVIKASSPRAVAVAGLPVLAFEWKLI